MCTYVTKRSKKRFAYKVVRLTVPKPKLGIFASKVVSPYYPEMVWTRGIHTAKCDIAAPMAKDLDEACKQHKLLFYTPVDWGYFHVYAQLADARMAALGFDPEYMSVIKLKLVGPVFSNCCDTELVCRRVYWAGRFVVGWKDDKATSN